MPRNRQLTVLIVLLVVFAAVGLYEYRSYTGANADRPGAAGAGGGRSSRHAAAQATGGVPTVRLDALQAARQEPLPGNAGRDVFKFQAKAAPPAVAPPPSPTAPVAGMPGVPGMPGAPAGEAMQPPPPPIPLKFIGIVQSRNQKVAVLTEETTRDVFQGREGDIVDGRYRILRIGTESIDMAYPDGRGRQTIRLSGQ